MTTASYRIFTGTSAENYERYFVPAIATPVSVACCSTPPGCKPANVFSMSVCGTGVIARFAAEQVGPAGSVTARDVSPDMIGVAESVTVPRALTSNGASVTRQHSRSPATPSTSSCARWD